MFRLRKNRFNSISERYSKRVLFGLINEVFKHLIISSDNSYYNLPFIHSWSRTKKEKDKWLTKQYFYEFEEIEHQKFPQQIIGITLSLLNGRVKPTDKVYDIGCNSGYYLSKLHEHGFKDLHGSDPQKSAIEFIKKNRPYISPVHGYFGDPETIIPTDLVIFFNSIDRIPYDASLFQNIKKCARKFVLIVTSELEGNFCRPWDYFMGRNGFICIEKRSIIKPNDTHFVSLSLFQRLPNTIDEEFSFYPDSNESC